MMHKATTRCIMHHINYIFIQFITIYFHPKLFISACCV